MLDPDAPDGGPATPARLSREADTEDRSPSALGMLTPREIAELGQRHAVRGSTEIRAAQAASRCRASRCHPALGRPMADGSLK